MRACVQVRVQKCGSAVCVFVCACQLQLPRNNSELLPEALQCALQVASCTGSELTGSTTASFKQIFVSSWTFCLFDLTVSDLNAANPRPHCCFRNATDVVRGHSGRICRQTKVCVYHVRNVGVGCSQALNGTCGGERVAWSAGGEECTHFYMKIFT